MRITLEPTNQLVSIDGVTHRVWQGHTEKGVDVHAYITRVAVLHGSQTDELDAALESTAPLRPELETIPEVLST